MNDQETWEERRKAWRFYLGKIGQEKNAEAKRMDMLIDLILAMETQGLTDVKNVLSSVLLGRARNMLMVHDAESFAAFMSKNWQ